MTNNDRLLTDKDYKRIVRYIPVPEHDLRKVAKAQLALDLQHEQERVERIFKEIEDRGLFKNPEHILLSDKEWEDLKGREGVK